MAYMSFDKFARLPAALSCGCRSTIFLKERVSARHRLADFRLAPHFWPTDSTTPLFGRLAIFAASDFLSFGPHAKPLAALN